MTCYYLIVLLIFVFGIWSVDNNASRGNVCFVLLIMSFFLTIIAGTRTIGYDYETYEQYFINTKPFSSILNDGICRLKSDMNI